MALYEIKGTVTHVFPKQYGKNDFVKRVLMIRRSNTHKGNVYVDYPNISFMGKKQVDKLDVVELGDVVVVGFDVSGRLWKKGDEIQFKDIEGEKCPIIFTELKGFNVEVQNKDRKWLDEPKNKERAEKFLEQKRKNTTINDDTDDTSVPQPQDDLPF